MSCLRWSLCELNSKYLGPALSDDCRQLQSQSEIATIRDVFTVIRFLGSDL